MGVHNTFSKMFLFLIFFIFRALKYQYNSNRANRVEPAVVQDMRLLPAFPEIDTTTYVDRPEAHLLVT